MNKKLLLLFLMLGIFRLSAQTVQQTIYIDLGPNDVTNGNSTTGADVNGHYWNSQTSAATNATTTLVNAANAATGFSLVVTTGMLTNGILNGGLLAPDPAKLGDMAIATATQDYFFTTTSGALKITGLNTSKTYKFYLFGSRTNADPARITTYTLTGANSVNGTHQTSGTNLGGTGYNGNNSTIFTSGAITPTAGGEIALTIAASSGGFAYLNMIKIEELSNVVDNVQKRIFVDFGPNDVTNGNITAAPDVNGRYWNNLTNPNLAGSVSLVDTTNASTGFTLSVTTGLQTNGILNGGLLAPDAAKLGNMAIATATQDYFFTTTSGALKLSGLNVSKTYKFYCFGSRNNADPARITAYTFTGSNIVSGNLQTSGTNLGGTGYNGNNSTFFISDLVTPSVNGEIAINIAAFSGGFAYLNMMRIEEWNSTQVDATALTVSGNDISVSGASSQMSVAYTPSNATPKPITWSVDDGSIATINATGLLTPKKNGTVTVTASILQNAVLLSATKLITISNQLTELFISGTATVNGDNISTAIAMNATLGTGGVINGSFELHTTLNAAGTIKFYTTQNAGTAITFGAGATYGTIQVAGAAIDPIESGDVLIRVNVTNNTFTIYQIDTLKISQMGSSVSNGYGATSRHGYAYQYNQLLNQRYGAGNGLNWNISNISVDGNTTLNLLSRWDTDLLNDRSKYVVYALSLANEGIASGGQPIFDQFKTNLLLLINKARSVGKVPIVASNYPNANYTATQYAFIKQINLLIQDWDVPSINLLGAIDDGNGRWSTGYQYDINHPNDAGHTELFYAEVPSLFDALNTSKPFPVKPTGTYLTMGKTVSTDQIKFTPDNIVHSFTESFDIKTSSSGTIATFLQASDTGKILINATTGYITFSSPNGGTTITGHTAINDGQWHKITLTHFYARGETILYSDSIEVGRLTEKILATDFFLNDKTAPTSIDYRDWFFYRSGMNADEILALSRGKMLKSSLELYAPLDSKAAISLDTLVNLAQSTVQLKRVYAQQASYIFNGDGNWDNSSNWLNNQKPPLNTASGINTQVIIDPVVGGECIINVPVSILNGAIFRVLANAKCRIIGGLNININ